MWPELKYADWHDTLATLHMWTQVVGKIRLERTPLVNHWWNVPLYVSARGLTTSAMPYDDRIFEIEFDFIDHKLLIKCSDGSTTALLLRSQSVRDFYSEMMTALRRLGMEIKIWTMPVEVPNPIRFEDDTTHASYDPEYVGRFWRALVKMDDVFKENQVLSLDCYFGETGYHEAVKLEELVLMTAEGAVKMADMPYEDRLL